MRPLDWRLFVGVAIVGLVCLVWLIVAGVLLDEQDKIVRLGSTYVLQENIEPGASVPFDLRIIVDKQVSHGRKSHEKNQY